MLYFFSTLYTSMLTRPIKVCVYRRLRPNTHILHNTIMDFSAGVHDAICTRKVNIDRGGSKVKQNIKIEF